MKARRLTIVRSSEEWLDIISEWKASKKSLSTWSKENGIPPSSLGSAHKRLFLDEFSSFSRSDFKLDFDRSSFQELVETNLSQNGKIEIKFRDFTLTFSEKFDPTLLLNLLRILVESK